MRSNPVDSAEEVRLEDEEHEEEEALKKLIQEEEELENVDDLFDETELFPGQRDDEREKDYFARQGHDLDEYEDSIIDDDDEEILNEIDKAKAKRAAERRMDVRDRTLRGRRFDGRSGVTTFQDDFDEDDDCEAVKRRQERRRLKDQFAVDESERKTRHEQPAKESVLEAKAALGSIDPRTASWTRTIEEAVQILFKYFLYTFSKSAANRLQSDDKEEEEDSDDRLYMTKLREMQRDEKTSLSVSVGHLICYHCDAFVAWLQVHPVEMLKVLDTIVTDECLYRRFEWYENHVCTVLLTDYPKFVNLRSLTYANLNSLIQTSGVVTKRTGVMPRLRELYLSCVACKATVNSVPYVLVPGQPFRPPPRCPSCFRNIYEINRIRTLYQNFQKLTLQESPGDVPAGRAPRSIKVYLTGALADKARPGQNVNVLGIFKTSYDLVLNARAGFPIFATHILANNIHRKEDVSINDLSKEDIEEIEALSKDKNIRERIIASMAPALCGHKDVKTAIAYAMFGGVPKGRRLYTGDSNPNSLWSKENKLDDTQFGDHCIRGDINVLLIGDPGLGKSQALQYVHRTFHRTVYTTGKGASAVGLTAGVKRDTATGEWILEGGALVLADEGICIIDEFDKMSDKDRTSIHEAMEQQSISISKAGIVTSLKARCAVIAAANPRFGRYDSSLTFKENVDLSTPILSRFDIIAVLKDIPNFDRDYNLADYVVTSHMLNHPNSVIDRESVSRDNGSGDLHKLQMGFEPVPHQLLQKFIIYARNTCFPKMSTDGGSMFAHISNFYTNVRQKAAKSGGYNLTLRHVESLIRISQANAKMRLAKLVTLQDVEFAIATMLESFISSQKHAVAASLGREFAYYRALARGGFEMLSDLLRKSMQDLVTRNRLRREDFLNTESQENRETDFSLSIRTFTQIAKKESFTDYNIQDFLASEYFKKNFVITNILGEDYVQSLNFFRNTENTFRDSFATDVGIQPSNFVF